MRRTATVKMANQREQQNKKCKFIKFNDDLKVHEFGIFLERIQYCEPLSNSLMVAAGEECAVGVDRRWHMRTLDKCGTLTKYTRFTLNYTYTPATMDPMHLQMKRKKKKMLRRDYPVMK